MEKRPSKEQLATFKKNANDPSISAEIRAKFQAIVDKFENVGEEVVDAVEGKKERKPRTPKATTQRKPRATKQTGDDIEKAKAEIKARTGKTEEECEKIIDEYRSLRTKSQERKKKEAEASKSNVARINKLKKDDKVIEGTNEKTADAVIETTTKDVADKIEKQIEAVEEKAETEAKKEVEKQMPKVSATEKKKAVKEKVEEKVKEKTKTIVKRVVIDTSALLTTIAESLGKFDKDSQKEFLIKLRSDIDKLISKYSFGGLTDGGVQVMNIQQSNLSSSSVNPTMFGGGGGVSTSDLQSLISEINEKNDATFYLRGAYGNYELWAKDKNGGDHRIEVGSRKDIREALIKNRYNEKYQKYENGGGVDAPSEEDARKELEKLESEGKITLSIGNHGLIFMQIVKTGNAMVSSFKKSYESYLDALKHYYRVTNRFTEGGGVGKFQVGDKIKLTLKGLQQFNRDRSINDFSNKFSRKLGKFYDENKVGQVEYVFDSGSMNVLFDDTTYHIYSYMVEKVYDNGGGVEGITPELNRRVKERAEEIYHNNKGKTKKDFDNAFNNAIQEFGYSPQIYHQTMREIGAEYDESDEFGNGGVIKVGDNVVITDDSNENYYDYLDRNLIVTHVRKDSDGDYFYDLEDEDSGEKLPFSFYENEIELFSNGGGVEGELKNARGTAYYVLDDSGDTYYDSESQFYRYVDKGIIKTYYFDVKVKNQSNIVQAIYDEMESDGLLKNGEYIQIIGFELRTNYDFESELPYDIDEEEYDDDEFKRGGNVNTGRSWKLDRARHNKRENYEVPMSSRKKAHGGTIEERMRMRRGR